MSEVVQFTTVIPSLDFLVFLAIYGFVILVRVLAHTFSRYLQYRERININSSDTSISAGVQDNIPAIV